MTGTGSVPDVDRPDGPLLLHASSIAMPCHGGEAGLLILGPSGSGKSSLALMLMAWGARLVADDNTLVSRRAGALSAESHPNTSGLIEARGVGLLRADPSRPVKLDLAVDLGQAEGARLPPRRNTRLLGVDLPLVLGPVSAHLAAALIQHLRYPRQA